MHEELERRLRRGGMKGLRRPAQSVYGIGDFHRTFTVGEAIDTGRSSAERKNGVVSVHLVKSEKVPRNDEATLRAQELLPANSHVPET